MKISGFTFIRNGIKLKYPFIESVQSILPICDEMVIAVGNSEDGTRDAIAQIPSAKIKIIDTVWNDALRTGGKILAQQTDIAFDAITGDWGFYLQGDEVVHEKDLSLIFDACEKHLYREEVDGLLFPYYHFYGNYDYIAKPKTRGTYPFEVRVIRNNKLIRSFRDAQGFRKFSSTESMKREELPSRLNVKKIIAHIYHYGKVRGPKDELERSKEFHKLWHSDEWVKNYVGTQSAFDYRPEYPLIPFKDSHPAVMKERIEKLNWDYKYDPGKLKISAKHRLMNIIEGATGLSPFSFRNYKILK